MKAHILVIDDDEKLASLIHDYLSKFSYIVTVCLHPTEGLKKLESDPIDLVILDIMLPDLDGFEVCRRIRKFSRIPIIMLTARGDVTDRIVGIELGADDYMSKPFEARELEVRIQAVLRRSKGQNQDMEIQFGGLCLDPEQRCAFLEGKELDLSTAEFDILYYFVKNPGRTLTRDQIIDQVKGTDWATFNRSVDVLISRLRNKLGDSPKSPAYIKTVWGAGYRFIGHKGGV